MSEALAEIAPEQLPGDQVPQPAYRRSRPERSEQASQGQEADHRRSAGGVYEEGDRPDGDPHQLGQEPGRQSDGLSCLELFVHQDGGQLDHLRYGRQGRKDADLQVVGAQRQGVGGHESAAAQAEHGPTQDAVPTQQEQTAPYVALAQRGA